MFLWFLMMKIHSQNKEVNNKVLINRGEKEKNSTSTIKPTRLTSESESMSRLRHRKVSESCLDTTSVGRVRTHSGCNQTGSPFNMPFSPPMSPYTNQPQVHNVPQDGCSIKTSEGTNVRPEDDKCTRQKQIQTSQEHINQPS